MLTLEEAIETILKQRPELDRGDVLQMIHDKREQLGPEIVNDESAALIIARELGIDLQHMSTRARLKISEITESSRSIALTAKVVSVGTVRSFVRKDGSQGMVASIVVADDTGRIRVALWDDMTRAVSEEIVTIGSIVQIRGAYVRRGLGGALELNLGRQGAIRVLEDYELEGLDFEPAESQTLKVSDITDRMFDISLRVKVGAVFPLREFTRRTDGSPGKVASVLASDETGSIRIVFWDERAEEIQDLDIGEVISVSGAYSRVGRTGDVEVHVGRSSSISRHLDDIDAVPIEGVPMVAEPLGFRRLSELTPQMKDVDIEGRVMRIFPPTTFERDGRTGRVQNVIVADDSGTIRVTFWNDDIDTIAGLKEGDILRIRHGYVKEGFRGGVDFQVGRRAQIEINPDDSALADIDMSELSQQPVGPAGRVMIEEIDATMVNHVVEVCGIVVGLSQARPVYLACPNCKRKVQREEGRFVCANCGESTESPEPRMLYKITVDDGSGTIRATLFGTTGEELLQMSAAEALQLIEESGNDTAPLQAATGRVLGSYVVVAGRVTKFRDSLDISAMQLRLADPVEEIRRMKERVEGLLH